MKNEEIIELYKQYCNRFQQYANQYKDKFESVFDKALENVVREELCAGSDMTLGYYCPSPVKDLLVGNVHRGKILKRITKRSKPDIKYGFTEDGKMAVFVDLPPEGCTNYDVRGFVLYDKNIVTHLCFRKLEDSSEPEWISQAEYDPTGRIVSYTLGLFFNGYHCNEISQEIYTYSDEGMKSVIMWNYLSANCISIDSYLLHHDSEGYLTGFESLDSDFWKGHIFEIAPSKRRKI